MIIRGLVLVAIVLGGFMYNQYDNDNLEELSREQVIIKGISTFVNYVHFSPHVLDDDYSEEVYHMYMESLDSRKQFFTQKEIDVLSQDLDQLDDQIKTFDLSLIHISEPTR